MVLTQYGTIATAVEATRLGAADYVTKPFHVEELRAKLDRLMHTIEMGQENRLLREELRSRPGFGGLVGVSPRMERVYKLIQKVAQHTYPVLDSRRKRHGKRTGRALHPFFRARAKISFCSRGLFFAHSHADRNGIVWARERRIYRRAHSKQGLFEAAGEGTLFLDEIGELPIDLQSKLLRALQEREIKPVGSNERVGIRARVIAATNRDLESAIRTGAFRQDLYFRLNVVQIKLPPLRERKADIPLLVSTFLEKFSDPARPIHTISEDAMRRIMSYDWPGNIRELENAIERAVALGSGPILHVGDLPSNLQYAPSEKLADVDELMPLETLERRAIFRALQETSGDKLAAARLLGIGKTTLYRKLKQYETGHSQA